MGAKEYLGQNFMSWQKRSKRRFERKYLRGALEVTCGASETRVVGLATARIAPVSRMGRCDDSRGSLRGFENAKFASDVRARPRFARITGVKKPSFDG
jgi:hypothetical protein